MQPLTPQEAEQATAALTNAIQATAATGARQNEQAVQQLAPGLATGSNAVGGYNHNRLIAPTLDPMAQQLVLTTKQAMLRQSLKDAQNTAQVNYAGANQGYRMRQYEFSKRKSLEAEARERARDAAAAAAATSAAGGAGSSVNDVVATGKATTYRQALQREANNGNGNAKIAIKYAGDDGRYDGPVASQAELNAMRALGVQGRYFVGVPVRKANPGNVTMGKAPTTNISIRR